MPGKRILIEIGHPAHVHHFKHMYWDLEKMGWTGLFVTKDKECAIELLKAYQLPYTVLGKTKKGIAKKIITLPYFSYKMFQTSREFRPDVFVSRVSPLSGYTSWLLRVPHITFTDTENVRLLDSISQPFADVILTSDVYLRNHGPKQLRYPGYHELAYLHPSRFTPVSAVVQRLGIDPNRPYAIIRFVTWGAHHDIGNSGFSESNRIRLVNALASKMQVYISAEGMIPDELTKYKLHIPAEQMHHVLAFAHMFVGESATMSSECAMLGTPAIYLNSNHYGSTDSQAKYGLIDLFPGTVDGQNKAIVRALEISQDRRVKSDCRQRLEMMLRDKIDVSKFMVWFVKEYPLSKLKLSNKPGLINEFKGQTIFVDTKKEKQNGDN